jgi:molecular chaperone DnaK
MAKDKATSKSQKIKIEATTNLNKDEVERMVKDSEKFADEDKKRKAVIEARNEADSLAYRAEKTLADAGDKVPAAQKTKIETAIKNLREMQSSDDANRIRQGITELTQALSEAASHLYQQPGAPQPDMGEPAGAGAKTGGGNDNVVDAEYKVQEDK